MAHLQYIKPESAPDYRILFDIDRTWTLKNLTLAVPQAFREPFGLVQSAAIFARLVWLKALDMLVDFLSAIGWHAYVLGEGVSCVFWLFCKGLVYSVVYLALVPIYLVVWGVSVLLWYTMGSAQNGE